MELLQKHTREYELLVLKQLKRSEDEKDLKEDIEYKDDLMNTFIVRDREMNDELQEARKAAVAYVADEDIQDIAIYLPETELALVIHESGTLDDKIWHSAFQKRFGEEWEMKGAKAMSKYSTLVLDPRGMYFRMVQENGKNKQVPDYNHPVIVEILKKYGWEVMEDFLRAVLDHAAVAGSASYTVKIAWNPKLNRRATLAEVVQFAKACGDVLIEKNKDLKALLPTEAKRKSHGSRP